MKRPFLGTAVLGVIVSVFAMSGGVAFALKITANPSGPTINEGSSQPVQLILDAPIICPMGSPTCDVTLTFNSPDAHVSASPTIAWNFTDWSQHRTLTINTTSDGIYTGNRVVQLSATAVSNAVYYSGFVVTIPVTVVDLDPAPPAPDIADKSVTVTTGKSIVVDVLTGVSGDPDAATLTIISGPSHGHAVDPPNTITYTPSKGYIGHDSLTYRVCSSVSNLVCSTAVLSFSVIAAAPDTGLVSENVLLPICLMVLGVGIFMTMHRFSMIQM